MCGRLICWPVGRQVERQASRSYQNWPPTGASSITVVHQRTLPIDLIELIAIVVVATTLTRSLTHQVQVDDADDEYWLIELFVCLVLILFVCSFASEQLITNCIWSVVCISLLFK